MKLTLGQIGAWTKAQGSFDVVSVATGYSIDSRTIGAGELFFAVKGERLDGHDYVAAALERGAVAAVVNKAWAANTGVDASRLLLVDDPLDSLQTLAHMVRRHWGKRVIGITGSAGKTTTKDAVAQVLRAKFCVLKSLGNLNNAFGLPLQLLKLEPEHEVAVIEMGMNHAGEIAALAKIAAPDWAVVSNVAPVHLENFADGISGIARAKYELIEALPANGVAFLNCDDPYVSQFGRGLDGRAIYFGTGPCADPRAEQIEEAGTDGMHFTVNAGEASEQVHLKLLGRHNVYNALVGIAVGLKSGMTLAECARAIEELKPADKRGEVIEWRGATIINDCYNSNPRALDAMVDALLAIKATRHIVIAGEMLELGANAAALHAACGKRMAALGISVVVGVRGFAKYLADAAVAGGVEAGFVETPEAAGEWLKANLREGDAVLVKASRGVRLEKALEPLR
ncbi:MAG: UDP-N-acetylmuramoyl-tripeptide--D-alanyl-D-alanine ligase [Acidobacteriaceae bacterium]